MSATHQWRMNYHLHLQLHVHCNNLIRIMLVCISSNILLQKYYLQESTVDFCNEVYHVIPIVLCIVFIKQKAPQEHETTLGFMLKLVKELHLEAQIPAFQKLQLPSIIFTSIQLTVRPLFYSQIEFSLFC